MSDYRNFSLRLSNGGLDLVSPPDLQPEGKYTLLENVRNRQEGLLTTRQGTAVNLDFSSDGVAPILLRRLDAGSLLVQKGDSLYRNLTLLTTGVGDAPVTTARFKSANTGQAWTYIGSATAMYKVKNTDGTLFNWGIQPPPAQLTAVAGTTGVLDSTVSGYRSYDWRYTYYSSATGAESNPSPENTTLLSLNTQQAVVTGFSTSPDVQVDRYRIYRRGGPIVNTWKLVDTVASTVTSYTDNLSDTILSLSDDLSLENDVPFNTVDAAGSELSGAPMPFVWGPFRGRYIFACGDINRPGFLYWTNPDLPDTASPFNNISVSDPGAPLVNGFIYGLDAYVWTRDNLYAVDFGGPDAVPTFVPRQVPLGMGLSGPYAFCIGAGMVFFLSKDGIYATDCSNQLESITKDSLRPLFMGEAVTGFSAVDYTQPNELRLEYCGQELHFLYMDTDGDRQHLFYDILHKRWQQFSAASPVTVAYGDENQNQYTLLLGMEDGNIYQGNVGTDDAGDDIQVTVQTGAWDSDIPLTMKEYGNCLLDADPQGTEITVTPIYDAGDEEGDPQVITGSSGRQSFPITLDDVYHKNIAFRLEWSGSAEIYQVVLLFRDDEEPVFHWEMPESSFAEKGGQGGVPGWFHVRDGYFCLRSTADVTLTQTVDGTAYTYTIPSTDGERRRQYVKLTPTKGKMYRWSLDSEETFRLYGEDTTLNVKQWNSALQYKPTTPFMSVGYAPYLRKGAGT